MDFRFLLQSFNINDIKNYIKNDIEDDWFQDPIKYEDYKDINFIDKILNNVKENVGKYISQKTEKYYIPKSNFTVRYTLESNFYDRIVYFLLTVPFIKEFDKCLSSRVFSHRYFNDKDLFYPAVQQWEKFEGIIRTQLENKYLVVTDIQNYYENIELSLLKKDLETLLLHSNCCTDDKIKYRYLLDNLIECLQNWCLTGKKGLPQNRDCSSFLANIYLHQIDTKMIEKFNYYRYMDDIRIICEDRYEARRALKMLVNLLRDKSMSLNGKKTSTLSPGSKEITKYSVPHFDLKVIDVLLKTKKKANVIYAYNLINEKTKKLIKENKYEEREFRFCINRLSKLARCKVPFLNTSGFWADIIPGVVNAIYECPAITDRIYEFLASTKIPNEYHNGIIEYLSDSNKAIYEWQNYLLWKLVIVCSIKNERLLSLARNTISSASSLPDTFGSLLYLSRFGEMDDKVNIRDSITLKDSYLLQRHKLLALKGMDWIKDDVRQISGKVLTELIGTYKIINSKKITENIKMPEKIEFKDIFRSIHQYE